VSKQIFRASSFGRSAADIYAGQVMGHRLEQSDSMLRGLIAERLLRDTQEKVALDYKSIPAKLEGTGHKRWAEYDKANGIDRSNDKLVSVDVWNEAIAAAACLKKAMASMNLDPHNAEYQGEYTLQLLDSGREVAGLKTNGVTCTTDFVWRDKNTVIDTKVMSRPLDGEYLDTYSWQLSVQRHATQCSEAYLLVAVQFGDKWLAQLVKPPMKTLGDIQARSVQLANEIASIHALNA
jgi:hypothetical protein